MAGLDDDSNSWVADLENALLEECSATDIYCICKGKPLPESLRPEIWQICLDVRDKGNQLEHFNEIFDLPNQTSLREDCKEFITKKLDNDDLDKLSIISDLESIITYYCKSHNVKYHSNNGWLDILLPLLTLKITKSVIYNIFEAIIDIYIPQNLQQHNNNDDGDGGDNNIGINNGNNAFNILRLLLLYHDPELCSFLDTKRIQPERYCLKWFQTLFAATNNNLQVIINMWDYYFQQSDPYFIFFLSLIIIINAREQILSMKINDNIDNDDVDNRKNDNERIINFLQQMPNSLEIDDVQDFCSLAQYYSNKTPTSFRSDLLQQPQQQINQQLCLPVNVNELLENSIGGNNGNNGGNTSGNNVRFFLIDCRPIEQYNSGHLSIAYHLDCNLMLQEPQSYHTVIQGLLSAQKQSILYNSLAGGEHLCFLGSGRNDEDQYLYMIIASFLQKHTQYVSILNGGYISLHNYLINNNLNVNEFLIDHNPRLCIVCAPYYQQNVYNPTTTIKNKNTTISTTSSTTVTTPSTSNDLFGKISAVMKTKSADIKGKLMDYIVNPNNNSNNNGNTNNSSVTNEDRHVSSTINGKRYRNVAPVFSIDDEHGNVTTRFDDDDYIDNKDCINDDNNREIVDISTILKMPDIIANFHCQEVKMNGFMFKSLLIITQNELIVIRELVNERNKGEIIVKRPLSAIVKITARKRHPDLITFKYGMPDGENLIITDMDRFLIPHAEKATKLVSEQILKQLKLKE